MSGTVVAGTELSSALLGVPPWTAMATVASWTNLAGFTAAQYRKWPLLNEVEMIGAITGGTATNGTVIFTFPAGFIPASNTPYMNVYAGTSTNAVLQVNTSGQLIINNVTAGQSIYFHLWFSLDA